MNTPAGTSADDQFYVPHEIGGFAGISRGPLAVEERG